LHGEGGVSDVQLEVFREPMEMPAIGQFPQVRFAAAEGWSSETPQSKNRPKTPGTERDVVDE